jgi:UDP-N-acetylmuramoyl-tripeptide--D-alanyl-D-alanine ligase
MVAACTDQSLATAGNYNNEIGVPLTLLRLRARHQRAVVELGMNHPGEIARLAAMAQPTIALVNNAQREHLEFMETVDAVARENGAVFAALPGGGTAVFPHDDPFTTLWAEMAREGATRRAMHFGSDGDADIALAHAAWRGNAWSIGVRTPLGTLTARLHIAGRHNVINALAASACALAAGVSLEHIAEGLTAFRPVKGRSRASALQLADGHAFTLVDDSYNANPDSVRAAVDVLAALPGPRLLVLGDMGEVGTQGPRFHAEVGAYARERGIETMLALGNETVHGVDAFHGSPAVDERSVAAAHFADDIDALNAAVLQRLPAVRSVLVKGSRFMKMERVAQAIAAQSQDQPEQQEQHDQGGAGHA